MRKLICVIFIVVGSGAFAAELTERYQLMSQVNSKSDFKCDAQIEVASGESDGVRQFRVRGSDSHIYMTLDDGWIFGPQQQGSVGQKLRAAESYLAADLMFGIGPFFHHRGQQIRLNPDKSRLFYKKLSFKYGFVSRTKCEYSRIR